MLLVFTAAAVLAWANGSNDVSKGIATLVGSGVTGYRQATMWGALWTAAVFGLPMSTTHVASGSIIGAGTAGLVSAVGAAVLGARVAIVERHLLGGDCLNYGCVPSKALIRAARLASLGIDVFIGQARFVSGDAVEVDGAMVRFSRAVVATGARRGTPDSGSVQRRLSHQRERDAA